MQQPPYDPHNQPTWQQPPQYPFSSPPPRPLPHQRFWRWFRQRSTKTQIITIVILVLSCSLCSYIASASSSVAPIAATPTPTQSVAQIATTVSTDTPTQAPTATPTPTPSPTAKPTPKPTQLAVKPTPTPKRCVAVNNNPWCYNFSPGGLIYTPPDGFCNYFNCIPTFYAPDDPGDGYIVECADGTFSQSGGESGACSHHGGVMRPLYSH